MQAGLGDAEVLRDLTQRRLARAGHRDDVGSELGRKRFRHEIDPSSKDESSQVRSQPNWGQSPQAPDMDAPQTGAVAQTPQLVGRSIVADGGAVVAHYDQTIV